MVSIQTKQALSVIGGALCTLALVISSPSGAVAADEPTEHFPTFTLESLHGGEVAIVPEDPTNTYSRSATTPDALLFTAEDSAGRTAILDSALIESGALAVAGHGFVDLSWEPANSSRSYQVLRNDAVIATTGDHAFRDVTIEPGTNYDYQIVTLEPSDGSTIPDDEVTVRGFEVHTPVQGEIPAQVSEQNSLINSRAANNYTTILYQTFIPGAFVNAPPAGCGIYNNPIAPSSAKYKFGGNNRSYNAGPASSKTRLGIGVSWSRGTLNYLGEVEPTKVYTMGGKLLETKTAGTGDIWAKQLSRTSTSADVRLSVKASNPFCPEGNSIQGAVTMTVTKNGAYAVISGSHRQMPNHEIYVMGSANATYKRVYIRTYADATCLVGWLCPTVQITGNGSY